MRDGRDHQGGEDKSKGGESGRSHDNTPANEQVERCVPRRHRRGSKREGDRDNPAKLVKNFGTPITSE
jgi:hypothetical protein